MIATIGVTLFHVKFLYLRWPKIELPQWQKFGTSLHVLAGKTQLQRNVTDTVTVDGSH